MKTYGGMEVYLHLSWSRYWMEVIGQLHALSALPSGKGPPCTLWVADSIGGFKIYTV
jgi:hypothetical protein